MPLDDFLMSPKSEWKLCNIRFMDYFGLLNSASSNLTETQDGCLTIRLLPPGKRNLEKVAQAWHGGFIIIKNPAALLLRLRECKPVHPHPEEQDGGGEGKTFQKSLSSSHLGLFVRNLVT